MKHEYIAYTKNINGQIFYFVKDLITIPGIPGLDPVETGFGMHQQFEKACAIAGIKDNNTIKEILTQLQAESKPSPALVVQIDDPKFKSDKKIS